MSSYDLSKTGIAVFLTGVTLVEIGNPIKELVNFHFSCSMELLFVSYLLQSELPSF